MSSSAVIEPPGGQAPAASQPRRDALLRASWRGIPVWMLGALGAWTVLLVPVLGLKGARFSGLAFLVMAVGALWAVGARTLSHRDATPALRLAAGWTGLVFGAYVAASFANENAVVALAVPAICIAAVVCARFPAAAVAFVATCTGVVGSVKAFAGFSLGPLIELALGGLWAAHFWRVISRERRERIVLWPGIILLLVYVAIMILEFPRAESFRAGIQALRFGEWYMLAAVLVAYGLWRRSTYDRLARFLVLFAVAVGAYAAFRYVVGPAGKELDVALVSAGNYNIVDGENRLFGSLESGQSLSVWATCAIPFCTAAALTWTRWWRVVAMAAVGLMVFAMFGTKVRAAIPGAVVGLMVTFAVYAVSRGFRPTTKLVVGALGGTTVLAAAAAVLLLTGGASGSGADHYKALFHRKQDLSYELRTAKSNQAMADLQGHPMGFGLGKAGRSAVVDGKTYSTGSIAIENSYLIVAYQAGYAVMALYVAGLLALLAQLSWRSAREPDRWRGGLGMGAAGALAAFMVMMFSSPYIEGTPALWVWLLVGVGLAGFVTPRPAQE